MKKINIIMRIFLYALPVLYSVYTCIVFSKTGSSTGIDLLNTLNDNLLAWCSNSVYFSTFYTWFNANISNGYIYINLAFAFCAYCLMIEFVILFKNVLMYLFNVANVWLEKGVTNGK